MYSFGMVKLCPILIGDNKNFFCFYIILVYRSKIIFDDPCKRTFATAVEKKLHFVDFIHASQLLPFYPGTKRRSIRHYFYVPIKMENPIINGENKLCEDLSIIEWYKGYLNNV